MATERIAAVLVKVLGLYCAVNGLVAIATIVVGFVHTLAALVMDTGFPPGSQAYQITTQMLMVIRPAAYLLAAYVLIRKTDWCLDKIGIGHVEDEATT